ncbi:hypothetical protein SAI_0384 [Streptococcus agalactiae H36B]|nr:hypothetical protein SAI_0384 [Streptococcus agalactiae H36B]
MGTKIQKMDLELLKKEKFVEGALPFHRPIQCY